MKLSLLLCAITTLGVMADFTIWKLNVQTFNPRTEDWHPWFISDSDPRNWGDVDRPTKWNERGDVSGNKLGFRCQGSGCGLFGPVNSIDQLEMHFSNNPLYHFTIYKDRGWKFYGLDGKEYGSCTITTGNDFDLRAGNSRDDRAHGYRKFRCRSPFTAGQINQGS